MQRLIAFIFVNTIQYPSTLKNNIYHSYKWWLPLFLHLNTSPVTGHTRVYSVDKTHFLVVTMDLIWLLFLNILSFNFVATPRKFRRFTRFIRSHVNHPAVVLTNKVTLLFCFFVQSCEQMWNSYKYIKFNSWSTFHWLQETLECLSILQH